MYICSFNSLFYYFLFRNAVNHVDDENNTRLENKYKCFIKVFNQYKKKRNTCFTKEMNLDLTHCSITFSSKNLQESEPSFKNVQDIIAHKQCADNLNSNLSGSSKENQEKSNEKIKSSLIIEEDAILERFTQRDSSNINGSRKFANKKTIKQHIDYFCDEDLRKIISENLFGFEFDFEFSEISIFDEEFECEKYTESFDDEKCRGKLVYCFNLKTIIPYLKINTLNEDGEILEDYDILKDFEDTIELDFSDNLKNVKTLCFFNSTHSEVVKISNNDIKSTNVDSDFSKGRIFISFSIILKDSFSFKNVYEVCNTYLIYTLISEIIYLISKTDFKWAQNFGVFLMNDYNIEKEDSLSKENLFLKLRGLDLLCFISITENIKPPKLKSYASKFFNINTEAKFSYLSNTKKLEEYSKNDFFIHENRLFSKQNDNKRCIDYGQECFKVSKFYNYKKLDPLLQHSRFYYYEIDVLNILARIYTGKYYSLRDELERYNIHQEYDVPENEKKLMIYRNMKSQRKIY